MYVFINVKRSEYMCNKCICSVSKDADLLCPLNPLLHKNQSFDEVNNILIFQTDIFHSEFTQILINFS